MSVDPLAAAEHVAAGGPAMDPKIASQFLEMMLEDVPEGASLDGEDFAQHALRKLGSGKGMALMSSYMIANREGVASALVDMLETAGRVEGGLGAMTTAMMNDLSESMGQRPIDRDALLNGVRSGAFAAAAQNVQADGEEPNGDDPDDNETDDEEPDGEEPDGEDTDDVEPDDEDTDDEDTDDEDDDDDDDAPMSGMLAFVKSMAATGDLQTVLDATFQIMAAGALDNPEQIQNVIDTVGASAVEVMEPHMVHLREDEEGMVPGIEAVMGMVPKP